MTTIEQARKIIEESYLQVLGRPPDVMGMRCFLEPILSGKRTQAQLIIDLKNSKEYLDAKAKNIQPGIVPISPSNLKNKIVIASTWGIKCGIATYTSYLIDALNKISNEVAVYPMNNSIIDYTINNQLVHIQHEFGIMPKNLDIKSKVIITFHTVTKNLNLKQLEQKYNIVAYVVHFEDAKQVLLQSTNKDIYLIPHGSKVMPLADNHIIKSFIRNELDDFNGFGIKTVDKYAFLFGFQSGDKNYARLINACKNTNIKLIISGARHECNYAANINYNKNDVLLLSKFLTDIEIYLYCSACDLLLFDYAEQKHYSCSGAMHRTIGSGNPVICSRNNHFIDIIENEQCLKFNNQTELEQKIKYALVRWDEFSQKSIQYAMDTSWDTVAKKHIEMYRKYVEF